MPVQYLQHIAELIPFGVALLRGEQAGIHHVHVGGNAEEAESCHSKGFSKPFELRAKDRHWQAIKKSIVGIF